MIDQSFKLSDKEFRIVLGDEGFESTHSKEKLIWPILSKATPTDWFKTELLRYRTHANLLAQESILVNSFEENHSYGGGFHLRDNQLIVNQPMEQKGISIIEL